MLPCATRLVDTITAMHRETVIEWHAREIANPYEEIVGVACEQHQYNYRLWHEEDIARSPDVGDARIAGVKRAIDGYNQQRNDWIERIDETLIDLIACNNIAASPDAPLNTETPGSAIDRLSILALRIYHHEEQLERKGADSAHRRRVEDRLAICHAQHTDLSLSLVDLLDDIFAGRKGLKLYRQLKMYNDPSLNPYLYERREAG